MTDQGNIDPRPQYAAASHKSGLLGSPNALVWMRLALLYCVLAGFASVVMFDALASIFRVAATSNTYGHIFVVPAVVAWLIWTRSKALIEIRPRPMPSASLALIVSAAAWLVGSAADIQLIQQAAYVLTLQILVVVTVGLGGLKALLFPTFFLTFLVPFGEEFILQLQQITANFIVRGLAVLGVPVYNDGVYLQTPSGNFEVAEACSGIRFMVSTLALGCLFAALFFKSPVRRFSVIILSLVIPIVANGLRALGIVYIAHVTDNAVAVSVDHVIYGWIFFAFVTAALIGLGLLFADGETAATLGVAKRSSRAIEEGPEPKKLFNAALVSGLILSGALGLNARMHMVQPDANFGHFNPIPAPVGWQRIAEGIKDGWKPHYRGADAVLFEHFTDGTHIISVYRAGYSFERQGAEMIGYGNGVAAPETMWGQAGRNGALVNIGGQMVRVNSVQLRGAGGALRAVWQVYWVDGKLAASPVAAKIAAVTARLKGRSTRSATLVLSAPTVGVGQSLSGESVLSGFAAQLYQPTVMLEPRAAGGRS